MKFHRPLCFALLSSNGMTGVRSFGSVGSLPDNLRNKFFGMRHGNSEANKAGIISSSPPVATVKHGLTELGQRQARDSSSLFLQSEHVAGGDGALLPPVIVSSDFKRASMTANILRATLLTKFEEVAEVR